MATDEFPKRVMHVCLSKSWGGLEMYPGRVTPEFQRQGWEVHGIALEGSRVAESLRAASVEPMTFRSRGAALLGVYRVLRYLKQHDIRVMHAHKSSDMRLGALLVSLWPELRLFFTDHMGVKKPKKDLYHRWAYSKLRRLFSISQATYKTNLAALPLPAERITQLYCGIDLSVYSDPLPAGQRESVRQSLGIPQGALAIALPGRIDAAKGHRVWVEALGQLQSYRDMPSWCGVIIGEAGEVDARPGGFADQLKARIDALGLNEKIILTGFRSDLAQCLKAMDIACVPSVNEAFGLSVIEAMAAGCPVVGSASGAIPELINAERGRIAPPDESGAWAEAMSELTADEPLRRAMGSNASKWVHERFSLGQHIQALADFYRQSE
jgi:glycosyltransferase involved in cell wall biosynthesis